MHPSVPCIFNQLPATFSLSRHGPYHDLSTPESLDDDERELLHMRFWRNMSFQEIAEALRISYSAAAVRMFRLLKQTEKRMAEL